MFREAQLHVCASSPESSAEFNGMVDYQKAFQHLVSDTRYLANLDWGKARKGHSEGTVRAHIAEIEQNLERLRPKPVFSLDSLCIFAMQSCQLLRTLASSAR